MYYVLSDLYNKDLHIKNINICCKNELTIKKKIKLHERVHTILQPNFHYTGLIHRVIGVTFIMKYKHKHMLQE